MHFKINNEKPETGSRIVIEMQYFKNRQTSESG
jgi:hypothetical protein